MGEVIAVVVGLVSLALAVLFGRRIGAADAEKRSRRIAEEVERRRKEQAAKEAGEAMQRAARERDAALNRPASSVVGDAMRRGQ